MTTAAIIGFGCKLQVKLESTYVDVPEVKGFNGPNLSAGTKEVTNLDSTAREYVSTLLDAGEVSFNVNYVPADTTQAALVSALANRTRLDWKIIFSDTGTTELLFTGLVTQFGISAAIEDEITAALTVKVTNWPTWS